MNRKGSELPRRLCDPLPQYDFIMSARSVGRPKLPGCLKSIRLREYVFNLWRDRKEALGFSERTDSKFAEFLLHHSR